MRGGGAELDIVLQEMYENLRGDMVQSALRACSPMELERGCTREKALYDLSFNLVVGQW